MGRWPLRFGRRPSRPPPHRGSGTESWCGCLHSPDRRTGAQVLCNGEGADLAKGDIGTAAKEQVSRPSPWRPEASEYSCPPTPCQRAESWEIFSLRTCSSPVQGLGRLSRLWRGLPEYPDSGPLPTSCSGWDGESTPNQFPGSILLWVR